MGIYRRLQQWLETMRSPEKFQESTRRLFLRARRFKQRIVIVGRAFRTTSARERLCVGICSRLPRTARFLANLYRRTLARRVRIVSVVGSFGKTTTTHVIARALGIEELIHFGANARSALAAAILRMNPRSNHAVIEVGIGGRGQMERFARLIQPNIAVVTCIGSEHLTSLGSLEVTKTEKAKMVSAVPSSGLVVLNGDDPNVLWMKRSSRARVITYGFDESNQVRATDVVENDLSGVRFSVHVGGETHNIRTRLIGRHMIYPILAAVAVAYSEGRDPRQIVAALEGLKAKYNRLQPIQLPNGTWLLLDAYKGALETIETALDALSKLPSEKKIVVLGEIEEPPGSQGPLYKALGRRLAEISARVLFVGGKKAFNSLKSGSTSAGLPRDALTRMRTDPQAIARVLNDEMNRNDLILIKGRSVQHLERVALILSGETVTCLESVCHKRHNCAPCPLRQSRI